MEKSEIEAFEHMKLNDLHSAIKDYLDEVDGYEDEAHDLSVFIQDVVNKIEADEVQIKQLEHK